MRFHTVLFLLTVGFVVITAGVAGGSSHYVISASPSVDTPPAERTIFNEPVEVEDIARVDPDEVLNVDVDAPSGEQTRVILYNEEKLILDKANLNSGNYEVSFDFGTTHIKPGSYAIVLDDEGKIVDAMPLVISGYHVTVNAPSSASQGESITVEADVSTVNDTKPIDRVQVVIGDESDNRRVTLDGPGGPGSYEETFTLDQLPSGDYTLYVGVQGEQEFEGRQELLGVSNSQSFTIESSTTTTSVTTTTTASGGALPGGGGAAPGGGTDGTATTDGDATTDGGTDGGPAGDGTTSDGGVITPNPSPTTPPATTETAGQPLGLLPPLLALLLVALLARRR